MGVTHMEGIVHGILQYARQHGPWQFTVNPDVLSLSPCSLRGWSGNGIITWINTKAEAHAITQLDIPAVNLCGALGDTGIPRVTVDNQATGRLAAEHLLECGFRRFGYYGVRGMWNAQQRGVGFVEAVEKAGGTCSVCNSPNTIGQHPRWERIGSQLQDWLASLTPPVGVFAFTDYRARMVLEACERLGLHAPDDVAVIGVNNDRITCEFCDPPLSSISHDENKFGYELAALLDRLMAGKKVPVESPFIPPGGIVRRRSTDTTATEDPRVAASLRFMREHLGEPIDVNDILRRLDVSRRCLENAFKCSLGHTPYEHLCHVRVQHAKQLLAGEDKVKMDEIAKASGFLDAKRMRVVFRRITGTSPNQYHRSVSSAMSNPG